MIELKLFAPYNETAVLLGEAAGNQELPMKKEADGYFRIQLDLPDGVYRYRFRVQSKSWFYEANQWVEIVDPYATEVDEPAHSAVLRIKDGKRFLDDYAWQHDGVHLPSDEELIIYELHVGDFSGGEADPFLRGKFADVIAKLDYLKDLGINAVELMPIKEFAGEQGWGYNPKYFFAPESSYGTTADLKRLVDECHARGMRVLLDGVYNHADADAPLAQIDHDYWFHHEPKDKAMSWGPEFNYVFYDEKLDVKPAWRFIGDCVWFWVNEYHIDGVRYDAARQLGNYEFMGWIVQQAKQAAGVKPCYNVAEYLPPDPSITGVDGPMDGCWNDPFKHTLKNYLCTGEVNFDGLMDAIDARRMGFQGQTNLVNYLANHDHDRLIGELGASGVFDEEAFRRARLGAVILLTAYGLPMIWMGEEFGEFKPKTTESNKIDWQHLASPLNQGLHQTYQRLIALRRERGSLRSGNLAFLHENREQQVLAYHRWTDEGDVVLVVLNLSGNDLPQYTLPNVPGAGEWFDWLSGDALHTHENGLTLDLPARTGRVLVKR